MATAVLATPTPIRSLKASGTQRRRVLFTGRGRVWRCGSKSARGFRAAFFGAADFLGSALLSTGLLGPGLLGPGLLGVATFLVFGVGAGSSSFTVAASADDAAARATGAPRGAGFLRSSSKKSSIPPLGPGTSGGTCASFTAAGAGRLAGGSATITSSASEGASFSFFFFFSSERVSHPAFGGSAISRSLRQSAIDCGLDSTLSFRARSIALRKPGR